MKTKEIHKKYENVWFFLIIQKRVSVWLRGTNNQNSKEIRVLGSEIIATQTTDDRQKFHAMTSADHKQSQAELKIFEGMAQGKQRAKFEEICVLGTEIIVTRWMMDGLTNFDLMSSAEIVKQS